MASSYDYPGVYKALDIKVSDLGCVMLDVEPLTQITDLIPEEALYRSENPDKWWINGKVEKSHLTLLYGLLKPAYEWRVLVDTVLTGWKPPSENDFYIERYEYFPSNDPAEPDYSVLVGRPYMAKEIQEAHQRLSYLPHVNTFPTYQPHVTLAYVKNEWRDRLIADFYTDFTYPTLKPLGLNYGSARTV